MGARRFSRAGIAIGSLAGLVTGARVYFAWDASSPAMAWALAIAGGLAVAAAVVAAATWVMRNARLEVASWGVAFGLAAFFLATVTQTDTLPADKWLAALRAFPFAVVVAVAVMAGVGRVLRNDNYRSVVRVVGTILLCLALLAWFWLQLCRC
jgi:hypothetical protein